MTHAHFLELRQQLVDCRATLRAAKDAFETVTAQREQAAIDAGQAGGSNAEARQRSLTIALATDGRYLAALAGYRAAEHDCERVEALLEAARDERRAAEWQIRAQLAHAILGTDIPSDGGDPYGDDAFDNTLDAVAGQRATRAVYVSDPYDHAMHVG